MGSSETVRWFREELYTAGPVIDRDTYGVWSQAGRKNIWERAKDDVRRIIKSYEGEPLPHEVFQALTKMMEEDARNMGMSQLPAIP